MKNNVIRFVQNNYNVYDYSFEDLLEVIFDNDPDLDKSICKSGWVDKDGELHDEEFFLEESGQVLCGKILTSYKECEAFNGETNVYRETFITRSGECLIFYTTYDRNNEDEKCKMFRFCPTDQSLADEEKWDVINELFYMYYKS
ncbi:hypothetical protein [Neobacillus muris]|uniref:hypothetical protein n=1 Tax=Neobacillus muris TaxID=2941334 RepID=UPI0020411E8A|nr:hypothetical protein [Neobacillus muris]